MNNQIQLYTSADGKISLQVSLDNETVWLTQAQMASLFGVKVQNITMHLKNVYAEQELDENSTCKDFLQVQTEGERTVSRKRKHYNLDAIISVGYRISSKRATQFRQWATQTLKQFLVQGYAINQKRLQEKGVEFSQIEQGFGDELFYPNIASRAAHLLYFVIKNHPLADGNKRTGSFLFLWYLHQNQALLAKPVNELINDNTLVALALLVAESLPEQKELMIRLVEHFILLKG